MSLENPTLKERRSFAKRVERCRYDTLKEMLDRGFPIDITLESLWPHSNALDLAAYRQKATLIRFLLENGANPHILPTGIPKEEYEHWGGYDVEFSIPLNTFTDELSDVRYKIDRARNVLCDMLLVQPPMPTIQEGFKYDEFKK